MTDQRAIALLLLMLSMLVVVLSFHWHPTAEASPVLEIRSVTMTAEGKTTTWDTIEDESLLIVWLNASSEPILTVNLEPHQRTCLTAYTSLGQPLVEVVGGIILETIDQKATIRAEKERCILTIYGTAPSSDQWVLLLLQDSVGAPLLIMTATPPSIDETQPEDAILQKLNEKIEDCPISESRRQFYLNRYYHAALEKNNGKNVTDFLTDTLNQLKVECTSFQEAHLAIDNANHALANQSAELSPEDQQMVDYSFELALLYLDAGRYPDVLEETQRILEILSKPPDTEALRPEDVLLRRLNESIATSPICELRKQIYRNKYHQAAFIVDNDANATNILMETLNQLSNESLQFREAKLAIDNAEQLISKISAELSPEDQQTVDYSLELALLYLDAGRYQDALKETQRIQEILNEPQINYVTQHWPFIVVILVAMVTILLVIKRRRNVSPAEQGISSPEVEGLIPP